VSPPRVFLRSGSVVAGRTCPFKAAVPPLSGPAPAAKQPGLLRLPGTGDYKVTVDLLDWITGRVLHTRTIPVIAR